MSWRCGIEIELLAPRSRSRRDLAERLAGEHGSVRPLWHAQSEPSLLDGTPSFDNLTQGFEVHGPNGLLAKLVDDLTITADLDRQCPSRPGWFRVLSDDRRLLHLAERLVAPEGSMEAAMAPLAAVFGTELQHEGGMIKVVDRIGSPVALATGLPGERERPCEIVTPPYDGGVEEALEALLAPARSLGFSVPREAAVHVHFEDGPLRNARVLADLFELWLRFGERIKAHVRTNPACVRLGPWASPVLDVVRAEDFRTLPWEAARARLQAVAPTKYVDLNIRNLVFPQLGLPTIEVRVLPGAITAAPIVRGIALFEGLLRMAVRGEVPDRDTPLAELLARCSEAVGQPA